MGSDTCPMFFLLDVTRGWSVGNFRLLPHIASLAWRLALGWKHFLVGRTTRSPTKCDREVFVRVPLQLAYKSGKHLELRINTSPTWQNTTRSHGKVVWTQNTPDLYPFVMINIARNNIHKTTHQYLDPASQDFSIFDEKLRVRFNHLSTCPIF